MCRGFMCVFVCSETGSLLVVYFPAKLDRSSWRVDFGKRGGGGVGA